jgi:hypothetical protein
MARLDEELQTFSKMLHPDWLDWAIQADVGYGPWHKVAQLAEVVLCLTKERDNA